MQPNRSFQATILLVERDDLLRRTLSRQLVALGHRVATARDAKGARLAWEQSSTAIDLLLTDVLLPGMGGPVLARKLRARAPELAVIYLSAHRGEVLIAQGVLTPGELCLSKVHPAEVLASSIHRALVPPMRMARSA